MVDFDLSQLSPAEQANLLRMAQNLIKFAHADMIVSGYRPEAIMNWVNITKNSSLEAMLCDPSCGLVFK